MQVELTRFKVKPGMSSVVDEWLKFLNDNMEGVLLTLEREKMYVETIFREKQGEDEYLVGKFFNQVLNALKSWANSLKYFLLFSLVASG